MFTLPKSIATIAVLAISAGSATAFAADAANVSPQPTLKTGQISPIRIPGTKIHKGTKLRTGQAIVSTIVRVNNGQTVYLRLTCPGSKVLSGIVIPEGSKVGFNTVQHSNYVGKHSVKLRVDASDKTLAVAHGTVYGLCHSS